MTRTEGILVNSVFPMGQVTYFSGVAVELSKSTGLDGVSF